MEQEINTLFAEITRLEQDTENNNRFDEIEKCYAKIEHLQEESGLEITVLFDYATFLAKQGKHNEAIDKFSQELTRCRKLAETNPSTYLLSVIRSQVKLAMLQCEKENFKEVEDISTEVLEICREQAKTNPDAYLPFIAYMLSILASAQSDTNRYEEAEKNYTEEINIWREFMKTNPDEYLSDYVLAYMNRGKVYEKKNKYEFAIKDYTEAIKIYPVSPWFYEWRGEAYKKIDQYYQAIDDFSEAIRLAPDNPLYYSSRGALYANYWQFDLAIDDLSEVIKLSPDPEELLYFYRGILYSLNKQYDLAIEDYTKSISLKDNAIFYIRRGNVHLEKGEYDLAINDYSEAIKLDPMNVLAYSGRGDAYKKKGQDDLAAKDFTEAERLEPNNNQQEKIQTNDENDINRFWNKDFQLPVWLPKKNINDIKIIHDNFANLSIFSLSEKLCLPVQIHVASVNQLTYDDYINSLSMPTTLATIGRGYFDGNFLFEIDPVITASILNQIRKLSETNGTKMTSISKIMIEIIEYLFEEIRESWAGIIDIYPDLMQLDSNPQQVQIVKPSDIVIHVSMETMVGDAKGMINFCIPFSFLRPYIYKLSSVKTMDQNVINKNRYKLAVKKDGFTLQNVPEEFKTKELCVEAVSNYFKALEYVPDNFNKIEILIAMIKDRVWGFRNIPEEYKTPELCLEAVKYSGTNLRYVPDKLKTQEIYYEAFKADNSMFWHIPENIKTAEMYIEAVRKNIISLRNIPEEFITEELCFASAKQDRYFLWFVPEKFRTKELYCEVINNNSWIFKELLDEFLAGNQKAIDTINHLTNILPNPPFDNFVRRIGAKQFLNITQQEDTKTIAYILACIEPLKASYIFQNLSPVLQNEIVIHIAKMGHLVPEIIHDLEQTIEKKYSAQLNEISKFKDIEVFEKILGLIENASEDQIINILYDDASEFTVDLRKRIFRFEDIVILDDHAIQRVMREIDSQELVKALKSVDTEVKAKVYMNLSKRAAEILKEDMEYMGPVRLKDSKKTGEKIASIVRNLERAGEITIDRSRIIYMPKKNIISTQNNDLFTKNSIEIITKIILNIGYDSEIQIIKMLESESPNLAKRIKNQIYVFEDIILLDDRAIQKIIQEVNSQDLAMALKEVDEEVQNKIFRNMTKRAERMLREDMDYMGYQKTQNIEEAQQKIISIIRDLEYFGEIVIYRLGDDEMVI